MPVLEVSGARRLRSTLKAAGDNLHDLRDAHAAAAGIVAGASMPTAPKVTGKLAASIRPAGTKTGAVVRAGGARVPYANPVHWGWAKRHIRPNPWLLRAAERTEPAWSAAYKRAVDRILSTIHGT